MFRWLDIAYRQLATTPKLLISTRTQLLSHWFGETYYKPDLISPGDQFAKCPMSDETCLLQVNSSRWLVIASLPQLNTESPLITHDAIPRLRRYDDYHSFVSILIAAVSNGMPSTPQVLYIKSPCSDQKAPPPTC
jgi:hypothetical protein